MEQLRIGILSTSSIAPRFIAAVREMGAGRIVALSSRTLEKAREKAALWEIPKAYGSHDQLLNDPEVDLVYISTVNAQHYPWAKAALLKGKHVLCEKPCTTSQEQTRELFQIAKGQGLFLMEAEKMLFLPVMEDVRKCIVNGDLGQIHMVEMSHSFSAGYNTWLSDPAAGGGTLLSSGIYAVQLLIWLFGGIRDIRGTACKDENGAEWQYILTGQMENGILFSARNSTAVQLENTAKIYGSRGYIEIPEYWKSRTATVHIQGQELRKLHYPCEHELIYEVQHVVQCLRQGLLTSPVVTPLLSIQGIEALQKVKESW